MKKLGTPTTLGEFRKLTEQYPDETLLQFWNEPVHELIDVDGELCFQETNPFSRIKPHIGIIGHGVKGFICGIDEAKTICIAHEHVVRYPDLPRIKESWAESDAPDRYLEYLKATLKMGEFRKQYCQEPEIPVEFQNLSVSMIISAENIKSLSEELKAYEHKNKPKKEYKGYERPYKFHR